MPPYHATALVLRKTRLGEADIIVNLLTAEGRGVRAVAKGMQKPTSRFAGRLEPGSVVDLVLHTGRTLDVVSDARSVDMHWELRAAYERSCAASAVLDVVDKLVAEGQPDERVFGLAVATLGALTSADPPHLRPIVTGFLLKVMAMHGYRPRFDACVTCECDVAIAGAFSIASGGVVCSPCADGRGDTVALTREVYEMLHVLFRSTMAEIAATRFPERADARCFELTCRYVAYHVLARIKALEFFREMHRT